MTANYTFIKRDKEIAANKTLNSNKTQHLGESSKFLTIFLALISVQYSEEESPLALYYMKDPYKNQTS